MIIAVNEAWARLLGYKDTEEPVGTVLADTLTPDSLRIAEKRISDRAAGRLVHDSQVYECFTVDKTLIKVEVSIIPWLANSELTIGIVRDVTERQKMEHRLTRLNKCMLSFGVDPVANINSLISLCAELMNTDCALYNRVEDGGLIEWYGLSPDGRYSDHCVLDKGLVCHEVIRSHSDDVLVVRDLQNTDYAHTDHRVAIKHLQTYVGRAVKFGGACVGVLSVVYANDYIPTDDDKKLMGVIAGAIGIEEERKHAADALRESEERFKHVLDCSRDGIFRLDIRDRCYDYLSPSMGALLGYTAEEMLEMGTTGIWYRVHPEDQDRMVHELLSMLDLPHEVKPPTVEYRFKHKNGNMIWISDNRAIIRDEAGEPVACVGNIRDITEKRKSEDALRESEARYRGLVESQQDLIVRVNPEGMFTFVNDAYCELFGRSSDELLGTSFVPLVHEDDIAATLKAMEKLSVPPYRVTVEQRAMTVLGWRWLAWEDCAILNEHGEIIEIQAIGRDITEKKNADDALRKAYNDLTKAYELQREFLNNVTHEVRTPLVAVKGYVDMLLEGIAGPVNSEQVNLLQKVLSSSAHLLDIVGTTLEMARLKSGALALRPKACKPLDILKTVIDAVGPQAVSKGIHVNLHHDCCDCTGIYDEEKFRIVLTNLLSNAVKFTLNGGVDIYADCKKTYTEIIVVDSGIGMPEDELDSIFAEFQQLDYPGKHKPTGFGLGLAITSAMVDIIGATLTVSSVKGSGSAFTLYVPCVEW